MADVDRDVIIITQHASRAAAEREMSIPDIIRTVLDPEISYDQNYRGRKHRCHQRGRFAVITLPDNRTVLTCLYRDPEEWHARRIQQG